MVASCWLLRDVDGDDHQEAVNEEEGHGLIRCVHAPLALDPLRVVSSFFHVVLTGVLTGSCRWI